MCYIATGNCQMFLLLIVLMSCVQAMEEPQCISRYDYDYKLLKQMLAFEKTHENFEKTKQVLQNTIQRLEDELTGIHVIICFN